MPVQAKTPPSSSQAPCLRCGFPVLPCDNAGYSKALVHGDPIICLVYLLKKRPSDPFRGLEIESNSPHEWPRLKKKS